MNTSALAALTVIGLSFEGALAQSESPPAVTAGPIGFSFESSGNVVKFRGLLHVDGRSFADESAPETADTLILRRVRPTLEGTLNGMYDFRFTPDFAGGRSIVLDASIAARFRPWATLTAGKFKVPVGLERLVSASDLRFIERAFPTSLVPNRDLGLQLGGDIAGGVVSYSVGYFNGVADGGSSDGNLPAPDVENDSRGDWAARIFLEPFHHSRHFALRGLGFGVAGTYVDSTGSAAVALLPSYRTPGQQTFFAYRSSTAAVDATPATSATFAAGERVRVSPQLYYALGRIGLLGEYVQVSQDVSRVTPTGTLAAKLAHTAWHAQLAWFVTGEDQAFKGFSPTQVFSIEKGTWGALELVARVHELDIDDDTFVGGVNSFADPEVAASKAGAWGVGFNWYFNQNYKWSLNYDVTQFEGGAAGGADRPDEKAIFTRVAIAF